MQLISSTESYHKFTSLDLLIKRINAHAKIQKYAIARKQSKQLKLEIFMKVVFSCDRDNK